MGSSRQDLVADDIIIVDKSDCVSNWKFSKRGIFSFTVSPNWVSTSPLQASTSSLIFLIFPTKNEENWSANLDAESYKGRWLDFLFKSEWIMRYTSLTVHEPNLSFKYFSLVTLMTWHTFSFASMNNLRSESSLVLRHFRSALRRCWRATNIYILMWIYRYFIIFVCLCFEQESEGCTSVQGKKNGDLGPPAIRVN